MNIDSEGRDFFSDRQKLTQIDHLHRLLFQCLQALETELPEAIRKTLDDIALQRSGGWKRHDDVPLGRNGKPFSSTHMGLVCARVNKWPTDLCVHFGFYGSPFRHPPWVGAYTRTADERLFKQVQSTLRPILAKPMENSFSDNEAYSIWEEIEDWPKGCAGKGIEAGGSVIGLDFLLDEGKDGVVAWIRDRIVHMLDALYPPSTKKVRTKNSTRKRGH